LANFPKDFSYLLLTLFAQTALRLTSAQEPGSTCIYRHSIERVAIATIVLKTERNPRPYTYRILSERYRGGDETARWYAIANRSIEPLLYCRICMFFLAPCRIDYAQCALLPRKKNLRGSAKKISRAFYD